MVVSYGHYGYVTISFRMVLGLSKWRCVGELFSPTGGGFGVGGLPVLGKTRNI